MIKSMTGFAHRDSIINGKRFHLELKSLNHRYFDSRVRLPHVYSSWEKLILDELKMSLSRGKIELNIQVEKLEFDDKSVEHLINSAEKYIKIFKLMKERFNLAGELDVSLISNMKELIYAGEESDLDESEWPLFKKLLLSTMGDLDKMRIKEGENLTKDIGERVENILSFVLSVESDKEKINKNLSANFRERIKKLAKNITFDTNRLEQEIAILSEKSDITEEIVRIKSHIEQFKKYLESNVPVGKKLDFLVQEMMREANTMSVKPQDAKISQIMVEVKSELEKIREQIQNLE